MKMIPWIQIFAIITLVGCTSQPRSTAVVYLSDHIENSTVSVINIVGSVAGMPPDFTFNKIVQLIDDPELVEAKIHHLKIESDNTAEEDGLKIKSSYNGPKAEGFYAIRVVNTSEYIYTITGFGQLVARGYIKNNPILIRSQSSIHSNWLTLQPGEAGELFFDLSQGNVRSVYRAAAAADVSIGADSIQFIGPNLGAQWRPNWEETLGLSVTRRTP